VLLRFWPGHPTAEGASETDNSEPRRSVPNRNAKCTLIGWFIISSFPFKTLSL